MYFCNNGWLAIVTHFTIEKHDSKPLSDNTLEIPEVNVARWTEVVGNPAI